MAADPEAARCERDLPRWLELRDSLRAQLAHRDPSTPLPATVSAQVAELLQLNPDSFESAWLAGLAATDPATRAAYLRAALAHQPAYPEDAEAIAAALRGTSGATPGDHRD
jgi:hypothetical protein